MLHDQVEIIVPKAAVVERPPNVIDSTTYQHFKTRVRMPSQNRCFGGELPARTSASHTQHFQNKYHTPPSPPPRKKVSENINTPRFTGRLPSPRPAPDQYYPTLSPTAPSYSFGHKLGEKDEGFGKGRTSWEKAWFATNDVWKIKTNFEDKWPEIGSHEYEFNCLGKKLPHLPCGPASSFGIKPTTTYKGGLEPSPNAYDVTKSTKLRYNSTPSYTMVKKDYSFDPWIKNKYIPGPGKYAPNLPAVKPRMPAFSFAKPTPKLTQFCN